MISPNDLIVEAFKRYPNDPVQRAAWLVGARRGVELYAGRLAQLVNELELVNPEFEAGYSAEAAHARGFNEARNDARTRVHNLAAVVMGNAHVALQEHEIAVMGATEFAPDPAWRRVVSDIAEIVMRKVRGL